MAARSLHPNERQALAMTSLGHGLFHWGEVIYPTLLLLLIHEFGLSYLQAGVLRNAMGLTIGLGSLGVGLISLRVSTLTLLRWYCAGCAVASLGIGLAQGQWALAGALVAFGLFSSIYHPAGLAFLSLTVRRGILGRVYGLHGIVGSLALAGCPLLTGWLATLTGWSWRLPYLLLASGFLMAGLVTAGAGGPGTSAPSAGRSSAQGVPPEPAPAGEPPPRSGALHPRLLLLYLTIGLLGLCYEGTVVFLPTYLARAATAGAGPLETLHQGLVAGVLASVVLAVGVLGQYLGGRLTGAWRPEWIYIGGALVSIPFLVAMTGTGLLVILPAAMLFSLFHFAAQPAKNLLVAAYTSERSRNLGFGISFAVSFGAGSLAASLAGFVADKAGLGTVFLVMAGLSALTGITALPLLRGRRPAPAGGNLRQ